MRSSRWSTVFGCRYIVREVRRRLKSLRMCSRKVSNSSGWTSSGSSRAASRSPRSGPGELVFQGEVLEAVQAGWALQATDHVERFVRLIGGDGNLLGLGGDGGGGERGARRRGLGGDQVVEPVGGDRRHG